MSISSILRAGVSGLQAAGRTAHAAAVNIANANTEGYRRLEVRQSSVVAGPADRASGVRAEVFQQESSPGEGVAAEGAAGRSVDLGAELVSLIQARVAYAANARTVGVADGIVRDAIDLLA